MLTDSQVWTWLTSSSPSQFLVGVAILVFGSKRVLSEKNVSESLGGLFLPFRWLRSRRERAAEEEASEIELLRAEVSRLAQENNRYHRWAVTVTKRNRVLQLWAAEHGLSLPPPPCVGWSDFEQPKEDNVE